MMRRRNGDTNEERKRKRERERESDAIGSRGEGRAAGNLRPSSVMAARLGAIGTHVCPERESRIRVLASGGDVRS